MTFHVQANSKLRKQLAIFYIYIFILLISKFTFIIKSIAIAFDRNFGHATLLSDLVFVLSDLELVSGLNVVN